jgi:hypothetical protein
MFKLDHVPAVIKPGTSFKDAVTAAGGVNAKPTRMTEVELHLEVNVTECMKQVEDLFPGADAYCKMVAGLEKTCKGEDRSARTKLPEMDVTVWYGADTDPVFMSQASPIKARVQLKVNEDGDGKIIIKPRVRLNNKALTDMAQLIKAEVKVSMEPSQMDLAEKDIPEPAEDKSKKKKGRAAQLHATESDAEKVDATHH